MRIGPIYNYFSRATEPFLRQVLKLDHGIASHDTFSRVFRLLEPAAFHSCLILLQKEFWRLCEKKYSKLRHPRAFLIQRIVYPESNTARIYSQAATQELSQQYRFLTFMRRFSEQLQGVVALDGKTLRRLFGRAAGKSPLHLASARAIEQRLVMGQIAVDDESNEITASPTRSPPVQQDHRRSQAARTVGAQG